MTRFLFHALLLSLFASPLMISANDQSQNPIVRKRQEKATPFGEIEDALILDSILAEEDNRFLGMSYGFSYRYGGKAGKSGKSGKSGGYSYDGYGYSGHYSGKAGKSGKSGGYSYDGYGYSGHYSGKAGKSGKSGGYSAYSGLDEYSGHYNGKSGKSGKSGGYSYDGYGYSGHYSGKAGKSGKSGGYSYDGYAY